MTVERRDSLADVAWNVCGDVDDGIPRRSPALAISHPDLAAGGAERSTMTVSL
jgi:hypothetical protein